MVVKFKWVPRAYGKSSFSKVILKRNKIKMIKKQIYRIAMVNPKPYAS